MTRGTKRLGRQIFLLVFCMILSGGAFTQSTNSTPSDPKWKWRLSPYVWLINISGSTVDDIDDPTGPPSLPPSLPPPQPGHPIEEPEPLISIDLSFQEIQAGLKYAALLAGEFNGRRFTGHFNLSAFGIGGSVVTPFDIVFQNNEYNFNFAFLDGGMGYKMFSREYLELIGVIGLRSIYFDVQVNTTVLNRKYLEYGRYNAWIDPVFGGKIKVMPLPWLEFVTYADISPLNPAKDLSFQVMSSANFVAWKHLLLSVGYRTMNLRTNSQDPVFDGAIYGTFAKIGVQF